MRRLLVAARVAVAEVWAWLAVEDRAPIDTPRRSLWEAWDDRLAEIDACEDCTGPCEACGRTS